MENEFTICVKDTGIGIPEDKLDAIFDRFYQLDSSLSRKYNGTGIGLALTKELVKTMGGEIKVKSRLNEGSIFIIKLPYEVNEYQNLTSDFNDLKEIKSLVTAEKNVDSEDLNFLIEEKNEKKEYKKILIVEDNIDMQKYLKSILKDKYKLRFASNGVDGIKKTKEEKPKLILTDVMMSKMDGYQFTEIIKGNEDF